MTTLESSPADPAWPTLFKAHRRYLSAVAYRLTGDVQDAEDLVQATFERALERPPDDFSRPLRPWLTRVITNLAIDLLRHRATRGYVGPWLPAPVEDLLEVEGWTRDQHEDTDAPVELRYAQLESAQLAFLLALETLEPRARAVLILRDVLGYTGPEVAQFLALSSANVRVILHRARQTLERTRPSARPLPPNEADASPQLRATIERFMVAIAARDHTALAQLLAEDVRTITDSNGEFVAARKIVTGREAVIKLLMGIAKVSPTRAEFRQANGQPVLLLELPATPINTALRMLFTVQLDAQGYICEAWITLAARKLAGINFDRPASD